jgi:hypothetical protein
MFVGLRFYQWVECAKTTSIYQKIGNITCSSYLLHTKEYPAEVVDEDFPAEMKLAGVKKIKLGNNK